MNFRVSDTSSTSNSISRINAQRSLLSVLQERISTGKRINRASDDPAGAEVVLRLRTSQAEIQQFARNAQAATHKLTAADDSLNGYGNLLDRVRTLVAQGLSGTTTQDSRIALATEIESLRSRILAVANSRSDDEYLFGGTRQNAPPYDPVTAAPAVTPTQSQYIQIEPGANALAVGVTANAIFEDSTSSIFTDLEATVTALRGTGDTLADRATLLNANLRLGVYSGLVNNARAIVGANSNSAEITAETLNNNFLSLDERASALELADFAETAIALTDAQRALEASLQVAARGKKSLFDYLG